MRRDGRAWQSTCFHQLRIVSPSCVRRPMKTASPMSSQISPLLTAQKAAELKASYWFPDITGWFQECEALHLFTAVQLARPKRFLEIGTFYGRSTATICSALKASGSRAKFISYDL